DALAAAADLQRDAAGRAVELVPASAFAGADEPVARAGRQADVLRQSDDHVGLGLRDKERVAHAHARDDRREDLRRRGRRRPPMKNVRSLSQPAYPPTSSETRRSNSVTFTSGAKTNPLLTRSTTIGPWPAGTGVCANADEGAREQRSATTGPPKSGPHVRMFI